MSQKQLELHQDFHDLLQEQEDVFNYLMSLPGEVFRDMPSRQTLRINHKGQSYFIKKHLGVGLKEILKNYFAFKNPIVDASHESQALTALKSAGIRVPEVLGYGSDGAIAAKRKSFIILEELKQTKSLETLALESPERFSSVKQRRHWIKQVAILVRKMHEQGVNHRDLYICHFLIPEEKNLPEWHEIGLIDLHRAMVNQQVDPRWRVKDLAALYFSAWPLKLSAREKLYFICCYTGADLRDVLKDATTFWQKVQKRALGFYRDYQKKYPDDDYPEL